MESLFIEPAALPGGSVWTEACESIVRTPSNHTHQLQSALQCEVSPTSGFMQVMLLLAVYGAILYKASELIAHGSELLLLVPSLRGIVGSVVLPILGAVPDGAIVLFSALGENAQEQVSVGVGALAGSTSMLLTLPWFLSILAGRVNIRADGVPTYHHRPHKLFPSNNFDLRGTGVQPMAMVKISGRIMLLTAVSYMVIQIAALLTGNFYLANQSAELTQRAARAEHYPAIFCFVICTAFFLWYLYYQITASDEEVEYRKTVVDEAKQRAIRKGEISLTAAFNEIYPAVANADESTSLVVDGSKKDRLGAVLRTFFNHYDHDQSRSIDRLELQHLMRDLGETLTADEISKLYVELDTNGNGFIELDEFIDKMPEFIRSRSRQARSTATVPAQQAQSESFDEEAVDEEEDEEEEVPDDLRHMDPTTQIAQVKKRSFSMMLAGTALVLIFSDPMVGVLSDIGDRVGVSPFYISFILAPLASNASELLAAYSYALKKTRKTVTISFSTLLGAAILNNTFVLAIFMLLIAIKGLAWQFTAETISILVVEVAMFTMSQKKIMTLRDGFVVLSLFPFSIFLVAFLENVVGLD